jgi:hypothetical protein
LIAKYVYESSVQSIIGATDSFLDIDLFSLSVISSSKAQRDHQEAEFPLSTESESHRSSTADGQDPNNRECHTGGKWRALMRKRVANLRLTCY